MEITLVRATIQDAENLWKMQIVAFQDLYAKYKDIETSPSTEPLEKVVMRLEQPDTYYYYIKVEDSIVGAVRVVDTKEPNKYKRISPIFIMKEFRGRGRLLRSVRKGQIVIIGGRKVVY
ncbi:MAG: hypothetical protein J6S05_09430 [Bacteroidaceae bacterium]|nr:hypothetical protein [Bacteroidaceae bacterium]